MTDRKLSPADEFDKALTAHADEFGVRLGVEDRARLRVYYSLVLSWNPRLHLVAPCPPAEFATRHVLESLLAIPFLDEGARVLDVGSGAGLPIIPCLVLRPDIRATLYESSRKKSVFLGEALRRIGAHERASVHAERFQNNIAPEADFLTCRALERFTETLPELFEWSSSVETLLLFGGPGLREQIERLAPSLTTVRVPATERRSLFVVHRNPAPPN
ncbi:MAG: class I SAM-dependent methyltransferase [Acidobacteria bacterium]|nr:class I SAM-dependent methyltransferase [Acidobacteriota bacterium]